MTFRLTFQLALALFLIAMEAFSYVNRLLTHR